MSNGKHSSDIVDDYEYDYDDNELVEKIKVIAKVVAILLVIVNVLSCTLWAIQIVRNIKGSKKPENNSAIIITTTPSISPVETGKAMPIKLSNYKVLGKIVIDKIKVEQYILEKTETGSLKVGVTKLYGPNINSSGNFCIAGHNYDGVFKDLNKLEKDDTFYIEDQRENKVTYKVTDKYSVEPDDMKPLVQNKDEKEVTLITCEDGATSRLVIKAVADNSSEVEKQN